MTFDPNLMKVENPKVISLKVMIDLVTAGKVKFSEKSMIDNFLSGCNSEATHHRMLKLINVNGQSVKTKFVSKPSVVQISKGKDFVVLI